ncbi:hypothetical protein KSS87_023753 [Heliosperma pusillum]|nr:hypothetical protein KSS87_023753 [Heliosperma pusillum]
MGVTLRCRQSNLVNTPSQRLSSSSLSSSSYIFGGRKRNVQLLHNTPSFAIRCSVAPNEVESRVAPVGQSVKPECYGVFCLTYDLKAEEETQTWKKLITVAVSGAAGMISNHLLFKVSIRHSECIVQDIKSDFLDGMQLASGEVFGPNQPVALKLLGSERSLQALEGIDPYDIFQDAEWALLIGAKPRGPGMERADLLDINGQIYAAQGKALDAVASRNVKVIVLALKAGVFYDKVPDFLNAKIDGVPVKQVIKDQKWLEEEFTVSVQKRGGLLIQKWGRSSAASTAVSIADAIKSLVNPTPEGDWFSSGVYTTGNPYGIADDLVFSMPCRSKGDGDYELVKDVVFDDYLWNRIKKSEDELLAEKRCTAHLTGEGIPVCDLPSGDTMLPGEM